jgi:tetratricopeptide (TPR) repeat protein
VFAARAHLQAEDVGAAEAAYRAAVDAGVAEARAEAEAMAARGGRYDAVVRSLQDATADDDGAGWFRIGALREFRLGDGQGALDAYRKGADAGFSPASDAAQRLGSAFGDPEELIASLRAHLEGQPDDNRARFLLALTTERLGQSEQAVAGWSDVLEHSPEDRLAMLGLARAARAAGDSTAASRASKALAEVTATPRRRSSRLLAAAVPYAAVPAGDALAGLQEAVDADPTNLVAVELLVDGLVAGGRIEEGVGILQHALEAAEVDAEATTLGFRLAIIHAWNAGNVDAASEALEVVLQRDPDARAAGWLMDSLGVATRGDELLARRQGLGSTDDMVASVVLADALDAELPQVDLDHPTLRTLALHRALVAGNAAAAVAHTAPSPWLAAFVAETDPEAALGVLRSLEGADWVASRLAEALGDSGLALRLLGEDDTGPGLLERARLGGVVGSDPSEVASLRAQAASSDDVALAARLLLAKLAHGADEAAAHQAVAELAEMPALQARHLSRAAEVLRGSDPASASDAFARAAELRQSDPGLVQSAIDAAVAAGDADRVELLFTTYREGDARGLGDALSAVDVEAAGAARIEAAASGGLYDRLALEQSARARGAWQELFDALTARASQTRSEAERARIESERRTVLADHLAETDAAYDLYKSLHDADPNDRDVLENLARISGARGETATAVEYLRQLAGTAEEPGDAARYERRIAEAHRVAGDMDAARQAFLDALDHDPDDLEALRGLQSIAEDSGDWQALLGVRKREAAIATGEHRLEVLRGIARLTEANADDHAVAVDAWRQVVEESPADREGLEHLLGIARTSGDHELFLETAGVLEGTVAGAERSALLREMGELAERFDRREDAIHHFEQAVAAEEPDLIAAQRLEALYRDSGDWVGVVRALVAQAGASDEAADQVKHLLEAASVERDFRHDREAAARLYEQVLRVDERQPDAMRFLVSYLFEAARYEDALPIATLLEPTLADDNDLDDFDTRMEVASFFFRFAEMLRSLRREDEAMERYERALELNPTHLPTLEAVGPLYVASGDWKKVGDVYRQVLQLTGGQGDPQRVANTYTMLGYVDCETDRMDRAHKRFNKALEAFPNFVPALKGLAKVLAHGREWNTLLTIYNSIIYHATVPMDVIEAYMTKGRVLDEQLQRPDKAIQHYERSLAFDRRQPMAHLRLAELAMRRNNWEDAADFSKRGLEVASGGDRAGLLVALSIARSALDDADAAASTVAEAAELDAELVEAVGDIHASTSAATALRGWLRR